MPKGVRLKTAECRELFPLSRLTPTAPPQRGALTPSVTAYAVPAPSKREPFGLFNRRPKAVPACGESGCECNEQTKGERLKETKSFELFPLSFAYAQQLPRKRWRLWVCSANSAYSAVPLRGAIVSMGLRGVQGGLRGEIEIFPGPPAKRL